MNTTSTRSGEPSEMSESVAVAASLSLNGNGNGAQGVIANSRSRHEGTTKNTTWRNEPMNPPESQAAPGTAAAATAAHENGINHESGAGNKSMDQAKVIHSISLSSSTSQLTQEKKQQSIIELQSPSRSEVSDQDVFARCITDASQNLSTGHSNSNISEETLSSKSSSSLSRHQVNEEHSRTQLTSTTGTSSSSSRPMNTRTGTTAGRGNQNHELQFPSSSLAFTQKRQTNHCTSIMNGLFPWTELTEAELDAFNQRQDVSLLPGSSRRLSMANVNHQGSFASRPSIGAGANVKEPVVFQTEPLGLPYPIDGAMDRDNSVQSGHAVVVARFPPLSTMESSFGSSDNGVICADAAADAASKLAAVTENHSYPIRRVSSSLLPSSHPWNNGKGAPSSSNPWTVASTKRCHDQITISSSTKGSFQEISSNLRSRVDPSNGFCEVQGGTLRKEGRIQRIKSRVEASHSPPFSPSQASNNVYTNQPSVEDCSSVSGSDGGYAASASSNDYGANSYPSTSSDDEDRCKSSPNPKEVAMTKRERGVKRPHESSSSSDLPDFSSGSTEPISNDPMSSHFTSQLESDSCSRWLLGLGQPHSTSSEGGDSNNSKAKKGSTSRAFPRKRSVHEASNPSAGLDACKKMARNMVQFEIKTASVYPESNSRGQESKLSGLSGEPLLKRRKQSSREEHQRKLCNSFTYALRSKKELNHLAVTKNQSHEGIDEDRTIFATKNENSKKASVQKGEKASNCTSIYDVGVDIMANILTHLEPTEVYTILSTPISKTWRATFTTPDDLWKVLCLSGPFYAKLDTAKDDSSDDSLPICKNTEVRHLFGCHRLLYSSFHRCNRYLDKIKEDSIRGLGSNDNVLETDAQHLFSGNSSLKDFFARARNFTAGGGGGSSRSDAENSAGSSNTTKSDVGYISARDGPERKKKKKGKSKIKFAQSSLTKKLLGPVHGSLIAGSYTSLPYSCAIYSIVNYMITFIDVVGIQIMCLKVLPHLLENEKQRTAAQHAGLTDTVLRAMVLFPDDIDLHTYAFHTLVLLARPLGKKEGMLLFRRTMLNESRMFKAESRTSMSGIAVMLDSMRRFASNASLQAMSCWSMVNIALIPSQKVVLVKLGGISVAANAMLQHPHNPEVQFRALFALINLVIPSENLPENSTEADVIRQQVGEVNDRSEREMLEESIAQIVNLVVVAMRNFCSSEAILNRACLVLHNLSLNTNYHGTLLHTPNCYQMLQWCLVNYRTDTVLQKSAGGTLQRLDQTLSNDDELRARFLECMRSMAQNVATENNNDY